MVAVLNYYVELPPLHSTGVQGCLEFLLYRRTNVVDGHFLSLAYAGGGE